MPLSSDVLEQHFPVPWSEQDRKSVRDAFQSFPKFHAYYTTLHPDKLLQGDGWTELEVFNPENMEVKRVKAIILSNTCDVDADNKRRLPANIVYAPLIRLSKYIAVLAHGITQQELKDHIEAIKKQEVTNIFYVPSGSVLDEDHIALLDDVHSTKLESFAQRQDRKKVFTLSQAGFYLFLMKLSIHFCRFGEGINRFPMVA